MNKAQWNKIKKCYKRKCKAIIIYPIVLALDIIEDFLYVKCKIGEFND